MSKALEELNFNDELPEDREELLADFNYPAIYYSSWGQWLGVDEYNFVDPDGEAPGIGDS
jgi:hypothetical protein